jgi:hypothetical protein
MAGADPVSVVQGSLEALRELQRVLAGAGIEAAVLGPPDGRANA